MSRQISKPDVWWGEGGRGGGGEEGRGGSRRVLERLTALGDILGGRGDVARGVGEVHGLRVFVSLFSR